MLAGRREGGNDDPVLAISPSRHLASSVFEGVAALLDNSLLRQEPGPALGACPDPRYQMLETVREFALDRLEASGEEEKTRQAHAAFFVALAERADAAIWGGPEHKRWLDCLEAELGNNRAALAWLDESGDGASCLRLAAALGGLWHFRSHRLEGHAWLTRALARGGDTVPAARAMALVKLVILERALGRADGGRAARFAAESVALRRQLGDERGAGRSLLLLASTLEDRDERDRAVAEATALFERLDDLTGLARARFRAGDIALEVGDADRAQALLAEALALYRRDGFLYRISAALLALGRVETVRGNPAAAAVHYAESLRLREETRSQEHIVDALAGTGWLAAAAGLPDVAARLDGAAAALGEMLGHVAPPMEWARDGRATTPARETLGKQEFAAAWAAGRALSSEQAIAEAFAVLASLASPVAAANGDGSAARAGLTPREREVLALIADGLSDREAAATLFVGQGTVRSHLTNIFGKLEVDSRTAAIAAARRLGIL